MTRRNCRLMKFSSNFIRRIFCRQYGVVITDHRVVISQCGKVISHGPAVVTRVKSTSQLLCVGVVYGPADGDVIYSPVIGGVICRYEEAEFMVAEYLRKTHYKIFPTICCLSVPAIASSFDVDSLLSVTRLKRVNALIMEEVVASGLDIRRGVIVYVAARFFEIVDINDFKVRLTFHRNYGSDDLIPHFRSAVNHMTVGDGYIRSLMIREYFKGYDNQISVYGALITSGIPHEERFSCDELTHIASLWADKVGQFIKMAIRLVDISVPVFLISDYDGVYNLAKELSIRSGVRIEPIDRSLDLIANELSNYDVSSY